MAKILKFSDPDQIGREISEYFSNNENARFVRRLDIILLVLNGTSIKDAAALFRVNPTTIQRWIGRVNKGGIKELKDKSKPGRPTRLTKQDLDSLRDDLEQAPSDLGYKNARWDGKLLSHHISKKYGVELRVRRCQSLFKELGFSLPPK